MSSLPSDYWGMAVEEDPGVYYGMTDEDGHVYIINDTGVVFFGDFHDGPFNVECEYYDAEHNSWYEVNEVWGEEFKLVTIEAACNLCRVMAKMWGHTSACYPHREVPTDYEYDDDEY